MNESTFDLSSMQSKPIVSRIKKTLTIVVVCDVLGQENNGTTIAAMHLIRALRNKGHHVRVVCSDIFRVGEQDYYIVPQLNLGPINRYVKKNGVVPATPDKRILDAAMDGADLVHIMMPLALGSAAAAMAASCSASAWRRRSSACRTCRSESAAASLRAMDFMCPGKYRSGSDSFSRSSASNAR